MNKEHRSDRLKAKKTEERELQLMEIVYENGLGYLIDFKKIVLRNRKKSNILLLISCMILNLIFYKIDLKLLTDSFVPFQLCFWGGMLLWLISSVFLLFNQLSISLNTVYTRPANLLHEEFLSQDYAIALKGLCISIDRAIGKTKEINRKTARNNDIGLLCFIPAFFLLFIYMFLA